MTRVVDPSLSMLFDQMPGLWGCKDENSVFMYANAAYGQTVGVKHHLDMVGRTDFDTPCDTAACASLFQAQDMDITSARTLELGSLLGRIRAGAGQDLDYIPERLFKQQLSVVVR